MLHRRATLVGTVLAVLTALAIVVASSGPFTLGPVTVASGASPFAGCTDGGDPTASPPSIDYVNTELEPFVAVNPTSPNNIIGAYQQDRWSDGERAGGSRLVPR